MTSVKDYKLYVLQSSSKKETENEEKEKQEAMKSLNLTTINSNKLAK